MWRSVLELAGPSCCAKQHSEASKFAAPPPKVTSVCHWCRQKVTLGARSRQLVVVGFSAATSRRKLLVLGCHASGNSDDDDEEEEDDDDDDKMLLDEQVEVRFGNPRGWQTAGLIIEQPPIKNGTRSEIGNIRCSLAFD